MKINPLKCLATLAALGTVVTAGAQTNQPVPFAAAAGPHIVFATPVYDFGKVDSGQTVVYDFVFTNTGDQLLEIKDVHPGCGCTTAGAWDKEVEPGKTGKIPVQFHSNGYGGGVQKIVNVTCNDPRQGSWTLQLKGTVWRAFDISPTYTVFNVLPDNDTSETNIVRITSNLDAPVTVSDPACGNPLFKTELKTVQEGKAFELSIIMTPPANAHNLNAPITIKTSSTNTPLLTVTAFLMVQPLVSLMPPQVMLPQGPLPGVQQYTVTLQNNGAGPLALSDPAINATNVDIQVTEMQKGRRFNVTLTFPAGFQNQPGKNLEATVKTSHPKVPVINIPVFQPVPAPAAASMQK